MRQQRLGRRHGPIGRCVHAAVVALAIVAWLGNNGPSPAFGEGALETIRSDVRTAPPATPQTESPPPRDDQAYDGHSEDRLPEPLERGVFGASVVVSWFAVTSPYWLPRALMDDGNCEAFFPGFPYDDAQGYLVSESWLDGSVATDRWLSDPLGDDSSTPADTAELNSPLVMPSRRWGGQFRADYGDTFANLTSVNGQLILESTSRLGVDASFQHLREELDGGRRDSLTLGDCNLVYRFAQHKQAQMRMGLGANWLSDTARTDCGFNFTYGGDFFPRKPWIVSAAIDWGTLGHAGLFRLRTSAGVIVNRFETYVGYEYLDVGTTQSNALIGGVRVWF